MANKYCGDDESAQNLRRRIPKSWLLKFPILARPRARRAFLRLRVGGDGAVPVGVSAESLVYVYIYIYIYIYI